MKNKLLNIGFIVLLILTGTGAGAAFEPNGGKVLRLKIVQIVTDSTGNKEVSLDATPAYDFSGQYPYYKVNKNNWKSGELLQIKFEELPSKGHLYVFSVDGRERFKLFKSINLKNVPDSLSNGFLFPNADSAIVVDTQNLGKARICILYAVDSQVEQFERLIGGLEFTTGTMMQRVTNQLSKRLYLPCQDWRLHDDYIGVSMSSGQKMSNAGNLVIPILLEFSNGADMPDAHHSRQTGRNKDKDGATRSKKKKKESK